MDEKNVLDEEWRLSGEGKAEESIQSFNLSQYVTQSILEDMTYTRLLVHNTVCDIYYAEFAMH